MKKLLQRFGVMVGCFLTVISMVACQETPNSSLVINKDFDKLIEEANTPNTDKVDINDITDITYDDYITSFEDSDLGVRVNVNAKVDIPKADHLSVFRVKQVPFTQALIDRVRTELIGEAALYDGYALNIKTKSDIEKEISYWRSAMNDTDDESFRAECQENINANQKRYETAPASIDLTDYPSDGKLCVAKEAYAEKPYYEWPYKMYSDGYVLSAITDGSDGSYANLTVYNSSEKSNRLEFSMNRVGVYTMLKNNLCTEDIVGDVAGEKPENYIGPDIYGPIEYAPLRGESCNITLEDAVSRANALLKNLGLDQFGYYDGELCTDYLTTVGDTVIYRTFYSLTFYRNIQGVFLTQSSGEKNNMSTGTDGTVYGKISWPGECITVNVNDDGIIGFVFSSPIEITETVVENAAIKSFEDVRSSFEKMMIVSKAGKYSEKVYDISRVRLSYSRISEADSYDTGLIIPVWDFWGYYEMASDGVIIGKGDTTALAINAIDGSIIDPDLGY